ncbi:MAG: hypothetical protein KDD82_11120 [Planctomycetes bacterium]|nr:hypothetical protein [Planctomycetota bacterium]
MTLALFAAQQAAAQDMRHEPAGRGREGYVIAAPHGGYDLHTEAIAPEVAKGLGWGLVIAEGYRDKGARRWFDVNRPTEREWQEGGFAEGQPTLAGRKTFARYREALLAAGRASPLRLLVEIHGHARKEQVAGKQVVVQAIELANTGFPRRELRALAARYQSLVAELPEEQRVPLVVEGLDETYTYRGRELKLYYRASGAKEAGSLAPQVTRRALHFELPPRARSKAARGAYAQLLIELLGPLGEAAPSDAR